MQSVEIKGFDNLQKKLGDFPDKMRELRREFFEEASQEILYSVRARIGGSGRLAEVQRSYVGSGGGYGAVRAANRDDPGGYIEQGGASYPSGYVTNALENGHEQEKGRYVPALGKRLKKQRVSGRYMYHDTAAIEAKRIVRDGKESLEKKAQAYLEGKT